MTNRVTERAPSSFRARIVAASVLGATLTSLPSRAQADQPSPAPAPAAPTTPPRTDADVPNGGPAVTAGQGGSIVTGDTAPANPGAPKPPDTTPPILSSTTPAPDAAKGPVDPAAAPPPGDTAPPAPKPAAPAMHGPDPVYDNVEWKGGLVVEFPPPIGTVSGEQDWRKELAKAGFGYFATLSYNYAGNLLQNAATSDPKGVQQYYGQQYTYNTGINLGVVFDLSKLGLEKGAQFVAGAGASTTNWAPAGPGGVTMNVLSVYVPFFDKHVELDGGYIVNGFEYYGPYVAGNVSASIFGNSGTVEAELGMSQIYAPRPGFNLKLNLEHFYYKGGVQESTSPDGYVTEHSFNPSSFGVTTPHAHVLSLNEFGYRREATSEHGWSWARVGYLRNTSDYTNFNTGIRGTGNYAVYIMGDQQLAQFGMFPFRGLYGGFSVHLSPSDYNAIDKTFEARVYAIGPFKSRPTDLLSVIVTNNYFSSVLVDETRAAGGMAHENAWTVTGAFNGPFMSPGVRVGAALAFTDHPSPIAYYSNTEQALAAYGNVTLFF